MFELEDYSSGFHDGFLNKYTESGGPTLDLYMSDSLQDMLHVDIRSEIANVVGGHTELDAMVNDLPTSLDHALEAISSINNNTSHHSLSSSHNQHSLHTSSTSTWMGTTNSSSWSSSNDFYADVGACVNPISVMPLISSSLLHQSPKTNLNANNMLNRTTSPPPSSPNVNDTKSHLTFSPAQIKLSAGAIRNEQLLSHIPKQIVAISSSVTAGTTAPATLATNSALQRKSTVTAVDAVKKDLGADLRKVTSSGSDESKNSSNGLLSSANGTNTIKLAPGIGGLTFANSITYNKLRQQTAAKSPQGSPITANGTIVLKRDRDASPLHHMATLNTTNGQKVLPRNIVQTTNSFTPKSIASAAHSPHHNFNNVNTANSMSSPSTASSNASSTQSSTYTGNNGAFTAGLTPITLHANGGGNSISNGVTSIAVKSLHQKIKPAPVEPEFPKPAYSYSCLIALALKNSRSGSLPVSEIYSFMCEHFPYFKTAPSGWKNSVRHNLSLNKCFEKIEKPATNGSQRKGCLWAMNPDRIIKMDEEVQKWSRKDPMAIRNAMVFPEHLESLERGEMKHGSSGDSDVELDSQSEIEETSDLEEQDVDETIVDNMFVEEDIEEDELLGSECGNGVHSLNDNSGILSNNIVVINAAGRSSGVNDGYTRIQQSHSSSSSLSGSSSTSSGIVCSSDELSMSDIAQKQRDFDIEVEDIYDAIDFEDDNKEAVRMAINQSDIIELSPSDLNVQTNGYQSPKRARLNINYSIGPAGELEKQLQQQNIKKIKLQPVSLQQMQQQQQLQQQLQQQQQQQQQQHHQQQHIVVQTISNVTTATLQGTPVTMATATPAQLQQITALAQQQRRKIQLVNRIA